MTNASKRLDCDSKDMMNEEEEVEVYFKVRFRINTWDGSIKEHEADLPGDVKIGDLKEELRDELGVPTSTQWYLARNNRLMSDDDCIFGKYNIESEDVINVIVGQAGSKVPEWTPVMESR